MNVLAKRAYDRAWVRRRNAEKLAAARACATRCPFRMGKYGVCGAAIEVSLDPLGRLVTRCLVCERREAGICRDCPRPVDGMVRRAIRCAECKAASLREKKRLYRVRHLEERRPIEAAHARRYRQLRPEYGRAYAKQYGQTHKAERRAYLRRWRAEHREEFRAIQRRSYHKRMAKRRALARQQVAV